jgi:oxaloacetate decarboxylase gamma subunit
MEEINLTAEALKFMALGMGIVFTFLTVMIFALKTQAFLIAKFFKAEEKKVTTKHMKASSSTSDDAAITAAITAAIIHHNTKG